MAEMTTAEKRPRFRRRKILLRPGYQLRVAATILFFILVYSFLLGFLTFYPMQQEFAASVSPEHQLSIARQILALHKRLWPSVLVVGVLVAIQSIFVTQRVVGPAYRIERILQDFSAGRYEIRVQLRRGDRLTELGTAVNALGEALLRKEKVERDRSALLRAAVAALQAEASGLTPPPKLQEALGEIGRIVADLPEAD
jgi:HAMP domain-containing protein